MPTFFAAENTALTRTLRILQGKRSLAILAIIITSVVSGGKNAEAFTNPFSIGAGESLDCSSGRPILSLPIKNIGTVSIAQYGNQWTKPTLYITYLEADGTTYYPAQGSPISNIAAGSEETLEISVERGATTFTIAIHATDPSGNTLKLLPGTSITPTDHCPRSITLGSHHVGTGPNLINAPNVGAVLQQHGGGGDPAQTVVLANRALALDPHDYASLATLAGANFQLGKTSDARTQLTRAISLATSAHDTISVAKFQAQLKAMRQ